MSARILLVAALLVLAPAQAAPPGPKETKQIEELPMPGSLPAIARGLLKKWMERHGRDQSRPVLSVTLLQRDVAKSIAGDLAAEPRITRPLPDARDELNSALPERFFVYQDALPLRAKDLAAAASNKDDVGLARSFGQMVEICVGCHSASLNPPAL